MNQVQLRIQKRNHFPVSYSFERDGKGVTVEQAMREGFFVSAEDAPGVKGYLEALLAAAGQHTGLPLNLPKG